MAVARAAANTLRICLLSSLQITVGDEAVRFSSSPKAIALFGYLVLNRSIPLFRDALAQQFWPESDEDTARANLRRYLYRITERLPGGPWLDVSKVRIVWHGGTDSWVDVSEFEALASTNPEDAIALYTGDLLPGCYDDVLIPYRERLRALQSRCLDIAIAQRRQARDDAGALRYVTLLRRHDPWREDAVRQAIELKYLLGDRAGAIAEYEQFSKALESELGVAPMPDTIAAYNAVLHETPLYEVSGVPPAPPPERQRHFLPLVGREVELTQLHNAWDRTVRGCGNTVLIGGEAGIGKSRLLDHFSHSLQHAGSRTLLGTTSPIEAYPYQAFAEVLRYAAPMIRNLRLPATVLALLSRMVPEFAGGASEASAVTADRERFFDAVVTAICGLARERPLLLLIEDLHWAGMGSTVLFERIAGAISSSAVLMIGTYREELAAPGSPLNEMLRCMQRTHTALPLMLRRLNAGDIGLLVSSAFPGEAQLDELSRRFFEQSEGNPLLLCEAIRDALAGGTDGVERAARDVKHAVESRLTRLRPETRALAESASVIGTGFDLDVLRAVTGWPEREMLDCLDSLLEHQIVRDVSGSAGADYAFTHNLIREAIYAGVNEAVRKRRHRCCAKMLSRLRADRIDELALQVATHYDRAGLPRDAAKFYAMAAERAAALFAHDEAAAHFERALRLSEDAEERRSLQDRLAAELGNAGDISAACKALEQCVAQDRQRADALAEARHSLTLGAHYWYLLDAASSLLWRIRAVDALRDLETRPPILDEARISVARAYALCGDSTNAHLHLDCVSPDRADMPAKARTDYYDTRGMTYALDGFVSETIASYEKAIEASAATTDLYTGVRCRMSFGANAMSLGAVETSRRASLDALALARERSMPLSEAMLLGNLGFLELLSGTVAQAREYLALLLRIAHSLDAKYLRTSSSVLATYIACRSDDKELLSQCASDDLLEEATSSGQPQLIGDLAAGFAELLITQGDLMHAARVLDSAVLRQNTGGDTPWLLIQAAEHGGAAAVTHARELLTRWSQPSENRAGHAYLALFNALSHHSHTAHASATKAAGIFRELGLRHYEAQSLSAAGENRAAAAIFEAMGNVRDARLALARTH